MPSSNLLTITPDMVFDLAGRKGKTLWALFDGDDTTRINVDGIGDALSQPWSGILALPNIYGNMFMEHYDTFGTTGVGLHVDLLDANRNQVATFYMEKTGFFQWVPLDISGHNNVRLIRFRADTYEDMECGIFSLKVYGDVISAAPSLYPAATLIPRVDPGKKGHGINTLDDKLMQTDGSGNVVSLKLAQSFRIPYEGTRWNHFPETYENPLVDSPLFLGRFGTDSMKNRVIDWGKANGAEIQVYHVGGSLKNLSLEDAAASNTAYEPDANGYKYIEPGADPLQAESWAGLAEMIYTLVALYANNPAADLTGKTIIGGSSTRGQNGVRVFEIGNEWTKDWLGAEAYHSPAVFYTALKAVNTRAKQADPNCKIYAAALTFMDVTFFRALYMVHYMISGPTPFPCDGFNMNLYLSDTLDGQAGNTALNPEAWGLYPRLMNLKSQMDLMFPNKGFIMSENGVATYPDSPFNAVSVGGKNVDQVAADLALRARLLARATRFVERIYYYTMPEDGSGPFNSMAAVSQGGAPNYELILLPAGYVLANELHVDAEYNFFLDMVANGGTTGNYILKADHITDENKKLFFVWRGTYNGSEAAVAVNVGPNASAATLHSIKYDNFLPNSSVATIAGETVNMTAKEGPQWLEVTYEADEPAPEPNVVIGVSVHVAKNTISFADAGITADNVSRIYGFLPLTSYDPTRDVNGIDGFEINKGYYIVAKAPIDLNSTLV